jgi:hypothetical protein
MGADTFATRSQGKTPEEAFSKAVQDAQWEHGHGGYSGTIAEKGSFILIDWEKERQGQESISGFINRLIDLDDERISDKWGDAGCVKLKEGEYVFFGWASS